MQPAKPGYSAKVLGLAHSAVPGATMVNKPAVDGVGAVMAQISIGPPTLLRYTRQTLPHRAS